jgi:chromosome segregation ATPase
MLNLDNYDEQTLLYRGQYATVRGAHEDEKKRLSILCGQLQNTAATILKRLQPDNDEVPDSIESLIKDGRAVMDQIEACAAQIESLAKQRAELKPLAWPKK